MQYTKREQLTVVDLKDGRDSVPLEELNQVILYRPSNIIYCEVQGKLVGIISMGDINRAYCMKSGTVKVNKKFTWVHENEYMRARYILWDKPDINAIPVVTDDGRLVGDYVRWDELLKLKYLSDICEGEDTWFWQRKNHVALVYPHSVFKEKQEFSNRFKKYLELQGVRVKCIHYQDVFNCFEDNDWILLADENEFRAMDMFLTHGSDRQYPRYKLSTYNRIMERRIKLSDDYISTYLTSLHDRGIHILGLTLGKGKEYYKRIIDEIQDKYTAVGEMPACRLFPPMYEDFFGELCEDEYIRQILSVSHQVDNIYGISILRDCHRQFYNVVNGERYTDAQPDKFSNTIYFFGSCYIYGHFVEDKHTIESFLQRRLNDKGLSVRVVNCGSHYVDCRYWLFRLMITPLKKGDVVIVDRPPNNIQDIKYIDVVDILEKNRVDARWLADGPLHCNHKVNALYADAIYESVLPVLSKTVVNQKSVIGQNMDFIKMLYLDRYFKNFVPGIYEKIGSIVMNCNPFTYGHRYLIEMASRVVDILIIFVVEEDRSVFSFTERFCMVRDGVADLQNVKVVPSGPFILSQMSFPEYFMKESSEDMVIHIQQDIITFAEKIAPPLNIQYRFVGEEPEDKVTDQYNIAMKKILPRYSIEVIEIPRKKIKNQYISASMVRKCLSENCMDKLTELVPETTREILGV